MKKKLTTLLFGLLLAVGWTSVAQAQLLRESDRAAWVATTTPTRPIVIDDANSLTALIQSSSRKMMAPANAPLRSPNTITADVTHTRTWYDGKTYTWYPSLTQGTQGTTASYTEVATDPYQMAYMVMNLYMDPNIPGIQYDEVYQRATPYPSIGNGWGITGTNFSDIVITMNNSYAYFTAITISDPNNNDAVVASWSYSSNGTTLPTNWVGSNSITYSRQYGCYMNGGGSITIPSSLVSGVSSQLKVTVTARTRTGYNGTINIAGATATLGTSSQDWYITLTGNITPPYENGYTVLLVKVKSDATGVPSTTSTAAGLIDSCFSKFESIELLTDGLRVGEGTSNAGTVFSYTGMLNRFFFISKGKTAQFGSYAPFYNMYEEFSPTTTDEGAEITDFYAEMTAGSSYPIIHDCASVSYLEHYFSMSGKTGTDEKSMSSLVFYIPDDRSTSPRDSTDGNSYVFRDYDHQPQVGLYTIRLAAETEPSSTYAQDSTYTVYLDWTSSLNTMVQNEVPQTYIIYKVTFDEQGNRVYTYLTTVDNDTHYEYNEDQLQTSQTFTYIILGYPTNATNKPVISSTGDVQDGGGNFFTYSNIDDVQIPGWFDFMVLYRERYESDFVISEEKNYYRNYLYPTNLTPGTGMTMGQLKQEWPNQTASYTLWRDNTGVAVLEVRGIGDKVYYRIRYYDDTQVKTGPNNITVPNYQTMDNN
ncbi:MAG: hypothetical protein IJV11_04235 [Muribaculaceae bacterium]|nr:hypothetical protein [Muribaculaceae bacterium]